MKKFLLLAIISLLLLTGCYHQVSQGNSGGSTVTLAGQTFQVELAQTGIERAQGLSGRESLCENCGMLFVFENPGIYPFWMNEMNFPLDIIWIKDDKVVDIWANAPVPQAGQAVSTYSPQVEANYVLEVNEGFADQTGLKAGDVVSLDK